MTLPLLKYYTAKNSCYFRLSFHSLEGFLILYQYEKKPSLIGTALFFNYFAEVFTTGFLVIVETELLGPGPPVDGATYLVLVNVYPNTENVSEDASTYLFPLASVLTSLCCKNEP